MSKHTLVASVAGLTAAVVLTLGAGCGTTTAPKATAPTNVNQTNQATKTTVTPTTTTTTTVTNVTSNVNTTVDTVVFDAEATDAVVLADVNGQWATGATASSQYGSDSWAAKQATGKPNVDVYGDNAKAWAPEEKNKGVETLEVTFTKAVYAEGVRIRENLGSGAVTKLELKDIDGVYHTVWTGTDTTKDLNYLQAAIERTAYKVNGVKVTFDTTKSPTDWVEVDAVQLVGE